MTPVPCRTSRAAPLLLNFHVHTAATLVEGGFLYHGDGRLDLALHLRLERLAHHLKDLLLLASLGFPPFQRRLS